MDWSAELRELSEWRCAMNRRKHLPRHWVVAAGKGSEMLFAFHRITPSSLLLFRYFFHVFRRFSALRYLMLFRSLFRFVMLFR